MAWPPPPHVQSSFPPHTRIRTRARPLTSETVEMKITQVRKTTTLAIANAELQWHNNKDACSQPWSIRSERFAGASQNLVIRIRFIKATLITLDSYPTSIAMASHSYSEWSLLPGPGPGQPASFSDANDSTKKLNTKYDGSFHTLVCIQPQPYDYIECNVKYWMIWMLRKDGRSAQGTVPVNLSLGTWNWWKWLNRNQHFMTLYSFAWSLCFFSLSLIRSLYLSLLSFSLSPPANTGCPQSIIMANGLAFYSPISKN